MIVINWFQRNSVQRNVIKSVGNVNCLVILRTSDKKASSFNKNQLTFSEKLWESICAVRWPPQTFYRAILLLLLGMTCCVTTA